MQEEEIKTLSDYVDIFHRRKKQIIVPILILFLITLGVTFGLSSVYRSSATILIEQQDIPPDLVRSTITNYADQRIQVISQRVMTTSNLDKIIEENNLYADERKRDAKEEIWEQMREDINFEMLSADVIDPRSGRPTSATIAFTLAYNNESPEMAQRVANELVSLYLSENLRSRAQKTAETSGFLSEESVRLGEKLSDLEKKMAEFKELNKDQLPELMQLNLQLMERTEREVLEVDRTKQSLEERKIYLESELMQIAPNAAMFSETGERIFGSESRLKALQAEFLTISAVYGPSHPDVIKMNKEIEALEREVGAGGDDTELHLQLKKLQTEYVTSREKYSEGHPDVKKLKKGIASLEQAIKKSGTKKKKKLDKNIKPDNPAYIQLQARLDAVKSEIKSVLVKKKKLEFKLDDFEERLNKTPQAEREFRALSRDYENALAKYQDIKAKQMEAKLSEEMEKGRKGERFSLIEPPLRPEKPYKPNRIAIMILGVFLSLSGGLGFIAVKEATDNSIHGAKDVARLFGSPPLAIIPHITGGEEIGKYRKSKILMIFIFILVIAILAGAVHLSYKPLDVLWFVVLRKLGLAEFF